MQTWSMISENAKCINRSTAPICISLHFSDTLRVDGDRTTLGYRLIDMKVFLGCTMDHYTGERLQIAKTCKNGLTSLRNDMIKEEQVANHVSSPFFCYFTRLTNSKVPVKRRITLIIV